MVATTEMQAPTLDAGGSNLPIKEIKVSGDVMPTLATLTIRQKFVNGGTDADVTYHCPLNPDWAVRSVTMRCGEQEITTIVLPKQEATQTFEAAKQAGHTAVLADEIASDEMRLQMANIPAGAEVDVSTEIVAWPQVEAGRGAYIIPMINGPKYGGTEAQQAYLDENDPAAKHTGCALDLKLAVLNATSDFGTISNDAISEEIDPVGQVTIRFDATPSAMWCEDETGKYLVVGVPVMRSEKKAPKWGSTALLIDHSGSMGGQGLGVAQEMCRDIAGRIGNGLRMVYAFDDTPKLLWADAPEMRPDRMFGLTAIDAISHINAAGGTQLNRAFRRVLSDLSQKPGYISDLVVVTDALVSQAYYTELINSIKALLEIGVAVHMILVGAAPGRFVGEAMSHASGGFYIEQTGSRFDEKELRTSVDRFLQGGLTLRNIKVGKTGFQCAHPVRGRPVMVAIEKIEKRPETVKVKFDGIPEMTVPVTDRPEARFVWAREKVMEIVRKSWSDGVRFESRSSEIEKIGVDHQILTPFTSFVGFDSTKVMDRTNVKEIIAQASLPVGIDPYSFHGINPGGALGLFASPAAMNVSYMADPGDRGGVYGSSLTLGSGLRMSRSAGRSRSLGDFMDETVSKSMGWSSSTADSVQEHSLRSDRTGSVDSVQEHTLGSSGRDTTWGDQDQVRGISIPSGMPPSITPSFSKGTSNVIRQEAATLLEALLQMIMDRKARGESVATADLVGDWVEDYGIMAIVTACTALKAAGLATLAGEIAKRSKSASSSVTVGAREDVEVLAAEIARELAA